MFETNEEYDRQVEEIYALALKKKRGDLIAHEEIKAVFGIEPNTGPWQHLMNRVRRRIERERYISTISIRELGYKLCTLNEQIALGPWRLRRAARQVRRGERSVKALDGVANLTAHQRNLQSLTLAGLSKHRRSLYSQAKASTLLRKPTPTNPRRSPVVAD